MANDVYANTLFLNKGQCSTLWPWQPSCHKRISTSTMLLLLKRLNHTTFFHCHIKTSVYFWHSYKAWVQCDCPLEQIVRRKEKSNPLDDEPFFVTSSKASA